MVDATAEDPVSEPPLVPEVESAMAEGAPLVEECRAILKKSVDGDRWQVGPSLIANSDKWGVVYRADFKIPGPDLSPLINRFVCWRTTGGHIRIMMAVGQGIAALDGTK